MELPDWVAILQMAEEWGIPPWQIEQEADPMWFERWQGYRSELNRATRDKRKHG